jgi:hypothetical protein
MAISDYLSPEQLQLMLNNTFGDEQNYVRQNPLQFQYPFIPGGITTQFDPRNFQSIFPTSGIRQQVPLQNLGIDTSYGVANEEDVEQEFLPDREPSGIAKLFEFLGKLPTPFNLARRGLESLRGLNDRIQGSDFGQATSLMDYLDMRKYGGAQGRDDAAARTMAQARGIQNKIDTGEYRRTAVDNVIDRGRTQESRAAATRSRDLGSMRGGIGR